MHRVRLALQAMATRFELVMFGEDPVALRAAGEEALREIKLLEQELSFYDPASVISLVNREAAGRPVRIPARVFELLQIAEQCHAITQGAFDITVGPLMKCWGFVQSQGAWPATDDLEAARAVTGMSLVSLDESDSSVAFVRPGVQIDLGAIGKGFAIEEAATILKQCGLARALLHGGTSSMVAFGTPPDQPQGWPIGIVNPQDTTQTIATVRLRDEAMSVSATWGKAFTHNDIQWGHVIDPRSALPVQGAALAAVAHPSATLCDALSTGLLILDPKEAFDVLDVVDDIRALTAYKTGDEVAYYSRGIDRHNHEQT